jgi:putative transposase
MLNPELRERLWPSWAELPKKTIHAQMHRRGCRPRSSAAVIANHSSHRQSHSINKTKAGSSAWIRQTFRQLHNSSWQQGYGAFSVSVSQLPETFHDIQNQVEHHRTRTFQQEYLAFLKRHEHSTHSTRCRLLRAGALSLAQAGLRFDDKYLWDRQRLRPSLRDGPLCIGSQALRAWLLSACPSGTKAIRPSKGLALS